ncbi:MAG: hypothetical protein HY788_08315 [Deltaproteobacteria bacterium]|nr:hypothetical protein [Deltaproteobacteria bacterium]
MKERVMGRNQVRVGMLFVICSIGVVFALSGQAVGGRHGGGGGGGGGGMMSTTLSTFQTADFVGSGVCALCHSGLTDSAGQNVSIDAHWRSTMMGNSSKDPLWQAKISSEISRNPALKAVIEEKCSRCHMGMARYQAMTDGTEVSVLSPGFLNANHPLHTAAMDGVSCTLCHQVQEENLGTIDSFTGLYIIDTLSSPPYRLAFGPYNNPFKNPMEMHSGFSPTAGTQAIDSALCGSCHTLFTPSVDAGGNVLGEFPEQTTFLEWEHAVQGAGGLTVKTCQDCHMPDANGSVVISNRPRRLSPRSPFGQHHFVGGNAFMVNLLKANSAALGVTADASHLDATIARTDAQLQGKTATVVIDSASVEQGLLTLNLTVENRSGHKFPSGIPARRSWLHVTVKDGAGRVLFESGAPQTNGSIAGNDADADPDAYEPHYDLITSVDEVQIYEPIMLDSSGRVTYTLLRAYSYAKDNRLLPVGFDKLSAPVDVAAWGQAADDGNFTAGQDRVTYQVDVSGSAGRLTVVAELLYQAVSYPFAENLRQDGTELTTRFLGQYDVAGKAPRLVATTQAFVQ